MVTLRQWLDTDLEPYAAMNADPEVMRYFPSRLSREQSEASLVRQRALIAERGWGMWVVDVDNAFAGFTGLSLPGFEAPFMPCVEIGWRLRREYWGRSIAYEAALQALDYGFSRLRLAEIVSFTAAVNAPSRRLMQRLGFIHDVSSDFDHPSISEGHDLRHHVFYRKKAPLG
jgi:RimJ/RimL family protein N-acetyltransferase